MKLSRTLPVLALGLWALGVRAEDTEPLDADFLEYLASLESEDGDWTELADEPAPKCDPKTTAGRSKCESDETEDAARDTAKRQ